MTEPRKVSVFSYGTFMHPDVLKKHGVFAQDTQAARLAGFELIIRPRVNLISSNRSYVYGSVAAVTHDDLTKIYSELQETFGLIYLPEAVVAETLDGLFIPALCYIAPEMPASPADPAYVKELAECSRKMGAPEWYIAHIESFR